MAVKFKYTSICSTRTTSTSRGSVETWSQQLSNAVADVINTTTTSEDRTSGAVGLWREWASVSEHFPNGLQQGIIKVTDIKLQATGVPSLRELAGRC